MCLHHCDRYGISTYRTGKLTKPTILNESKHNYTHREGKEYKDRGADLTSKTNDAWLALRRRLKPIRVGRGRDGLGWALFSSQMQMNLVDNDKVAAGKGRDALKGAGQVHAGAIEK